MDKKSAIQKLSSLIEPIDRLKQQKRQGQEFMKWHRDTEIAIEKIFGTDSRHISDFDGIDYSLSIIISGTPDYKFERAYQEGLDTARTVLTSFIDEINEYWNEEYGVTMQAPNSISILEKLCQSFHKVVHQLKDRHANRETLTIEDEYDVQDLFHALLKIYFDDIRDEEWTPSYAGACSRVDFLLKQEKIVIEIKKTRKGLGAKEVGDQLLIDIQRYKSHPFCGLLVCFVYDPDKRVANPKGIENDLNREIDGLNVKVFIYPKDV